MRNAIAVAFASVLLTGTVLPSYAGSLLGGVVGGDGDHSVVTLSSGSASDSGLVNVGLGGGDGNLVDVNVGGSDPVVSANVGTGNGVTIDANVGGSLADVGVSVGGSGGLVNVGVDLGGGGVGVDVGVGGPGSGGGTGGPGSPGGVGTGSSGNPNGPVVLLPQGSAGSGSGAVCVGESPDRLARLIGSTRVDASWMRASNVAIKPVMVCPEVKAWLTSQLAGSGLGAVLQNAVQSDALLSTSLSRSSYSADRVFAVRKSGSQLTVFVY